MEIVEKVKILFKRNHKTGGNFDYTCPSLVNYPHQWLWDSSFHAIVLTHFDVERAKREIETLLKSQKEDGFIPCVSIWKKRHPFEEFFYTSKITQPPVIPISVETIYKKSKDIIFIQNVYPKLKKFMDWLFNKRDTNNNSLIEIVHPWETGIDSTPTFDNQLNIKQLKPGFTEVMFKFLTLNQKKFKSENILMNSVYIKSLKSMSYLAGKLGLKKDQEDFIKRYKKSLEDLLIYSWSEDKKIFFDLDNNGVQIKIKTISSLMPLIIDDLPKKHVSRLIEHLTNKKEFWSDYPIPSVSMDEPTFNPAKNLVLWRGPSWVNTNWFLAKALFQHGYKKEAKYIIKKTLEMTKRNGFWEFYNPKTGKGYGQSNFGWSTLIVDMVDNLD